jgi:hypothetical protein
MTVFFHFQGTTFEWDSEKANSNVAKHGIDFEEAAEVFFDPFYQGGEVSVDGERRDFVLGYSLTQRMILVVYTERGTRTRIISARPATRYERKLYEEA